MILDEATSSLDSETEAQIQQGISRLIQNKTVVAVAHRLSTLKAMDRIVVLDKGRIIEEGTPDELIKKAANTPSSGNCNNQTRRNEMKVKKLNRLCPVYKSFPAIRMSLPGTFPKVFANGL